MLKILPHLKRLRPDEIPDGRGVYVIFEGDEPLRIGKTTTLKNRMMSYFTQGELASRYWQRKLHRRLEEIRRDEASFERLHKRLLRSATVSFIPDAQFREAGFSRDGLEAILIEVAEPVLNCRS